MGLGELGGLLQGGEVVEVELPVGVHGLAEEDARLEEVAEVHEDVAVLGVDVGDLQDGQEARDGEEELLQHLVAGQRPAELELPAVEAAELAVDAQVDARQLLLLPGPPREQRGVEEARLGQGADGLVELQVREGRGQAVVVLVQVVRGQAARQRVRREELVVEEVVVRRYRHRPGAVRRRGGRGRGEGRRGRGLVGARSGVLAVGEDGGVEAVVGEGAAEGQQRVGEEPVDRGEGRLQGREPFPQLGHGRHVHVRQQEGLLLARPSAAALAPATTPADLGRGLALVFVLVGRGGGRAVGPSLVGAVGGGLAEEEGRQVQAQQHVEVAQHVEHLLAHQGRLLEELALLVEVGQVRQEAVQAESELQPGEQLRPAVRVQSGRAQAAAVGRGRDGLAAAARGEELLEGEDQALLQVVALEVEELHEEAGQVCEEVGLLRGAEEEERAEDQRQQEQRGRVVPPAQRQQRLHGRLVQRQADRLLRGVAGRRDAAVPKEAAGEAEVEGRHEVVQQRVHELHLLRVAVVLRQQVPERQRR